MSEDLPPELRVRIRAYLEDVAPAAQVDDLEAEVHARLADRATRQPAQVLSIAHETVASRIRISPEAAATALVDHGGLSPMVAAHVVGLPVDAVAGGTTGTAEPSEEPDPDAGHDLADGPEPPGGPEEPAGTEPIIEGWDDFWTPPAGGGPTDGAGATDDVGDAGVEPSTEPADATADADEPVRVRPDVEATPARRPVTTHAPFETWTGGATRRRRGPGAGLAAAVVGLVVVALAVVGLLTVGDDGEQIAVGGPDHVATNDTVDDGAAGPDGEPQDDAGAPAGEEDAGAGTDPDATDAPGSGAVAVEGAEITAEDGGPVRAGGTALVSLTIAGTGGRPATLLWELRRDGEGIFPPAPLAVSADGEVRLAVPPALLADAGAYAVRVTHEGALVFERDFEVSAG